MATVKIVLRKKITIDGLYPLTIRITQDRRSSFIHLGKQVLEKDWDDKQQRVKKSHPNSGRLNNFLIQKLAEANDKALELETQTTTASSRAVRQKIKPSGGSTFLAQADVYLAQLKLSGKFNRYTPDKSRIESFRKFLKGEDIAFSDVTVALLNRFQVYLKTNTESGERSIINHLVVIRSVFSHAIKENVTERKFYPFGAGKISIKFPPSLKVGLSSEEVQALEAAVLPAGSFQHHARNLWLFSFYFAGMRASDVLRLKWKDIQNDRLYYSMGKNLKTGSLKIPTKAEVILAEYLPDMKKLDDYIFPDLKVLKETDGTFATQKKIAYIVGRLDKFLRKHVAPAANIEKRLTMHIARHTFGNISGEKIPLQMLQKLYRHSSITTTIGYQANFIHRDADDALDAVVNF